MNVLTLTLFVHSAATLAMCGVIWFVQIVHYPLFKRVGTSGFSEYEASHERLTSFVVMPLMLIEAATAIGLTVWLSARPLVWWGLALLLVIWVSTFAVQVPQHRLLEGGFDAVAHRRLVRTNWLRTIAWSVRGTIALGLLPGAI
jgi:hypothetical protein